MKAATLKKKTNRTPVLTTGTLLALALSPSAHAQTQPPSDPVVDALIQKGILTQGEAEKVEAEIAARQNAMMKDMPALKPKVSDAIKSMELYGDFRLRYEYRGVDNAPRPPGYVGSWPNIYSHERFRYAFRVGVRGDLYDYFSYGIRLETSNNPRSPWDTFGNNTTGGSVTPSDKNSSGIYLGQAFLNFHPADWYEMTVGRMPMPLYTTPMVWDADINPEGAFEKFKHTVGNVDMFVDFGQFDYQNATTATQVPSSDVFLFAWQAGATVRFSKDRSLKIAPVFYNYTGVGSGVNPNSNAGVGNGLHSPFVGQGADGSNVGVPGGSSVYGYNEQGINDLLILEVPGEYDFKIQNTPLGTLQARLFGDFAYNLQGGDRASTAYKTNPSAFPGLNGPVYGQDKAYQAGIGIGSAGPVYGPTQGLVYGSTSKKNTWEARFYWQHIEQYALDVNLLDSDFFEGRANLQGFYTSFAYSFTDAIIGTVRYGYANRINRSLGTGGNNLDIPQINPINNFNLVQLDLTWRF